MTINGHDCWGVNPNGLLTASFGWTSRVDSDVVVSCDQLRTRSRERTA